MREQLSESTKIAVDGKYAAADEKFAANLLHPKHFFKGLGMKELYLS